MSKDSSALVVFGRLPTPGIGKTRLRAAHPDDIVDRLCEAFYADTVSWAATVADRLILVVEAGDEIGQRDWDAGDATVVAQGDGDFGTRIVEGYDAAFDLGASRVVMIGTDCPTLPADLLRQSFAGLDGHGATLIPARDGGWIGLGLTRRLGTTLSGVVWSDGDTCAQTVHALARDGRPPLLLPAWHDVDTPADVNSLAAEMRQPGAVAATRAPRTASILHGLRG